MKKLKSSLMLPTFLIIGPASAFIGAVIIHLIAKAIYANMVAPADPVLLDETPMWLGGIYISTFFIGAMSVIAFLPCLLLGFIVRDRRKSKNLN